MVYLDPTLNVITRTLRSVGKKLVREFNEIEKLQSSIKGTSDFSNETYIKLKKNLIYSLQEIKPDYKFIFNNSKNKEQGSSNFWFIDPLNGLTNFSHGIPHFCISLAIIENSSINGAAVYDPIKDEMFYAYKGKGSYLNDSRIRVSSRKKLEESILCYNFESSNNKSIDKIYKNIKNNFPLTRVTGSSSLDMCYVACGRYEVYLQDRYNELIMPAEGLIVREAGGIISNNMDNNKYLTASNISCHAVTLEITDKT